MLFVEAPQSVPEIERIAAEVKAPLLLNIVPGGLTPVVDHARLAELGYRIVIHPGVGLGAVVGALVPAYQALRGRTPAFAGTFEPKEFFDLFGLSEWNALGQRYSREGE
ncbi:MAG TPA: hypothetical protein VHX88_20205 [Solirubrobacteraceae bacterium]|nr:hypothetical protein [Solirubrobacteraceae bacterium]